MNITIKNDLKLNVDTLKIIAYICINRILLDICYFGIIVPNFKYMGFVDKRVSFNFVISWIILFCSIPFILKIILDIKNRISNLIICTIYFISYIPFSTCIYSGIFTYKYIICNCIYWITLLTMQIIFNKIKINSRNVIIKFKKVNINDKIILFIGIISLVLILYISIRYTGFRINIDLNNVYDLRLEARSYNLPTIINYLFSWSKIINPIFLGYSILNKKYILSIVFFLTQIVSFGIDGLKLTLMITLITVFICFFYKKTSVYYLKKYIGIGLIFILILSLLEKVIFNTFEIIDFIIRRILFIPNYLNYYYFDFFQYNIPDYFRGSFLRHFGIETPYPQLGNIIGEIYYSSPQMNCNDGLIADAITNFGIIGIFIMPVILTLLLRVLDLCTINIDSRVLFSSSIYTAYIFVSSFSLTVLLTHGYIIMCILLLFMKKNNDEIVKRCRRNSLCLNIKK